MGRFTIGNKIGMKNKKLFKTEEYKIVIWKEEIFLKQP